MTEAALTGTRGAVRLLATRNFGAYFVGNAASATGTWFQNLAAAILIYRLTHSSFLLGVLAFSNFVPTLVLVRWSGVASDRFDRRLLLLATQLAAAALSGVLAALAFAGDASAWVVIVLVGGVGVATAFANAASQSLVPALVDRADIPAAVALNSVTYNLARAIGPALAGLAVKTIGIPAAFAVNAGSYLLLVAALLVVRPHRQERIEGAIRLRDTLRYVRGRPELAAMLVIVAVAGFASDPVNTLAPAYAKHFHHSDTFSGILIAVFGVGAVAAAFLLTGRVAASRRRLALALVLEGVGVALFSVSPSLAVAFVFLFATGAGYLSSNTGATSRLQLDVDEAHRGRAMALWAVAFLGLRPFASLLDGGIASAFGVRWAGVVLAIPALLAALGLVVIRPPGRRSAPPPAGA